MAYSIFYFDEVEMDIKEARLWYKSTSEKLERRFVEAMQKSILKLLEWPKAYAIRYKNVRIAHPPIFPYSIHFYIDDVQNRIVIIAIIHGRRHPDVAKKRL
jgi:plasmid stabilization system protein ParE